MDSTPELEKDKSQDLASRFPTAYSILFLLIILIAGLTWIIPAGKYDREMNEAVGREVAVAGTYHQVEPNRSEEHTSELQSR